MLSTRHLTRTISRMSKDPDRERRLYSTFHCEYALEGSQPGGEPSYTAEGSTSRWKPREATLHHRREPRPWRDGFQLYRSNVAEAKRNPATSLERNPNRAEGETMLAKVGKVMSTNVPRVKSSDTILEAANVMNHERTSGAAVVEGEKVVGLITERALLWKFVPLNKRPDEVTVGEMLVPFFRID